MLNKKEAKRLYRGRQRTRLARSLKDLRKTANIKPQAKKDAVYSLTQIALNYPKL